ncbi:MAG: GNAT family N-acetyltransferase [Flavobacteriales bacterium]|nr:GNAT family N-acetyltransferase [Flavobacteriales bacterium]
MPPKTDTRLQFVAYHPRYAKDFKDMNEAWITKFFTMEDADHRALDNPQSYIIDTGGDIIIGLYEDRVVGVCALIKMKEGPYDFELAKMAVDPSVQGIGLGYQLGLETIQRARDLGAKKIFLESNTKLEPAINLYRKLGFQEIPGMNTPYCRCNITMDLEV